MSVVDIPRDTLDPSIWDCSVPECRLRDEVKNALLDTLRLFFIETINDADMEKYVDDIFIAGSAATFQWTEDGDIDVKIQLKKDYLGSWQYEVLEKNRPKIWRTIYIGKHPVEFWFLFEFDPERYDAAYSILRNVWIKRPPELEPFDPRVQFFSIWHKVEQWCEDVDEIVGEMRRDVIDYAYIHKLLDELPENYYPVLLNMLSERVRELNEEIQDVVDKYNELHEERTLSFESLESIDDDFSLISANWLPGNIKFKFAERYKYKQLAKALKKIIKNKGIVNTPEDVEEVAKQLNLFFEVPEKTTASLFVKFTKEGRRKVEFPFKYLKRKRRMDRISLPVKYPYGFMITEDNVANEIVVTEEEGFNTGVESRPVPSNNSYQANPSWEEVDSLLFVPASLEKVAQEPETPPPEPENAPTDTETDFLVNQPITTTPDDNPTARELRRLLEPSEREMGKSLTPTFEETPEAYFKSVKPDVPESAKKFNDYDKWLYFSLEKKRTEAINKLDVALLRTIDGQIEKLIEKYSEPVPAPKPITRPSSELAASVKSGSLLEQEDMDTAVENLFEYLLKVGLVTHDVRLGYSDEKNYEFIVNVPINLQITGASFSTTGIQDTISTKTYKPVIIKVSKNGVVQPYMWTLDGTRYDLTSEGVRELINSLQSEVSDNSIEFVVAF